MLERRDHRVTDHVVDEIRPDRARIAKIARLNGRAAVGENPEPRIAGMALEVDSNVDFELVQKLGDLAVAARVHVMELIK